MPFNKGGGIHCFPLKQVRDLIAITGKIFLGIDLVFQAIAALPHILAMHFKSIMPESARRERAAIPISGKKITSNPTQLVRPAGQEDLYIRDIAYRYYRRDRVSLATGNNLAFACYKIKFV